MRSQLGRCAVMVAVVALEAFAAGSTHALPFVCDLLGPVAQFKVVATGSLHTESTRGYYLPVGPFIFRDDVCAHRIAAGARGRWGGDIVATRDSQNAITFGVVIGKRPGDYRELGCYGSYPCNVHYVYGEIATGGGLVTAFGDLLPERPYARVIDTSGTHPLVGECQSAISHVAALSTALAQGLLPGEPPGAARSIIELGDLRIARDDEVVLTPTGPGVTIYRVRDLILDSGRAVPSYFTTPGGFLTLDGSDAQVVVVNVTGQLKAGRGAVIQAEDREFAFGGLVNVVGPGPSVRLREFAEARVPILAPQRNIRMSARGGGSELYYGEAALLAGQDVTLTGSAHMYQPYFGAPCGLADQ